jgi:hypothetical protein
MDIKYIGMDVHKARENGPVSCVPPVCSGFLQSLYS